MWVWIKRSLFLLVGLVLLGVLAVVFLLVTLDPNQWKPQFEAAAAKQGLNLDLQGEMSWQWFPSLALRLGETTLNIADPNQPVAANPLLHVLEARAAVAVKPLFQRQIVVEEITLIEPKIHLIVDADGNNNFTLPEKTDAAVNQPEQPTPTSDTAPPQVTISSIAIEGGLLSYTDLAADTEWLFDSLQLQIQELNVQNQPFRFRASTKISQAELPTSPTISMEGTLTFNNDASTLNWQDGSLAVEADDADLELVFSLNADFKNALAANGKAELKTLNPTTWLNALGQEKPEMANAKSLSRFALRTDFALTDQKATLDNLSITLDDSDITGKTALTFPTDTPQPKPLFVDLLLNINQLNVDDYLAPTDTTPATSSPQTTTAAPGATSSPPEEPLPLDLLTALDMNTAITIDKLQVSSLQFTKVNTQLQAKAGVWTLSKFSALGYDGNINANAKVLAQNNAAIVNAEIDFSNLSLLPLLTTLAEVSDIEGNLNGKIVASTQGKTSTQLFEKSTATVDIDSPNLKLNGINLEAYYCQAAAQMGQAENLPATWPEFTNISNTKVKIAWANQGATIQQLVADAVNLRVTATGSAQLASQHYSVRFPLQLLQQSTSTNGCLIPSNFLRERDIDIVRCHGSLETLDLAKQCGVDTGAVADLAKQALRYNAKKKIDPKKQEIREELKDKLNEKLNKNKSDVSTQFLKEFLK